MLTAQMHAQLVYAQIVTDVRKHRACWKMSYERNLKAEKAAEKGCISSHYFRCGRPISLFTPLESVTPRPA